MPDLTSIVATWTCSASFPTQKAVQPFPSRPSCASWGGLTSRIFSQGLKWLTWCPRSPNPVPDQVDVLFEAIGRSLGEDIVLGYVAGLPSGVNHIMPALVIRGSWYRKNDEYFMMKFAYATQCNVHPYVLRLALVIKQSFLPGSSMKRSPWAKVSDVGCVFLNGYNDLSSIVTTFLRPLSY